MKSSAHPSHRRGSLHQAQPRGQPQGVYGNQQSAAAAVAAADGDRDLATEQDSLLRIDAVGDNTCIILVILMVVMLLSFTFWGKNGLTTSLKAHEAVLHGHRHLLPQSEGYTFLVSPLYIENQWFVPGTMEDLYGAKKTKMMFSVKKTGFLSVYYEKIMKFYTINAPVSKNEGVVELDSRTEGKSSRTIRIPLYGGPNEGYCAMIAIGSKQQAQRFCVLIDTGSSNLAIAATDHEDINEHFNVTSVDSSFHYLDARVSVSYTGGRWSGRLATSIISAFASNGSRLEPIEANIALIESSEDFFIKGAKWQGIMGLAYAKLAKPDSSVEPYWDSVRKSCRLHDVFSLQFCPTLDSVSNSQEQGGQLILGGPHTLNDPSFFYTPIIKEDYYQVLITNMSVAGVKVDISCTEFNEDHTIVDSGTTDIYFPTKAFQALRTAFLEYFKAFPNFDIPESFWRGDSKLAWPSNSLHFVFTKFPTLYIAFASYGSETEEFSLGVTPQIYLRQVKGSAKEQDNPICQSICDFFVFGIKERDKGAIIGGNILLGFITVFDREMARIGFSKSTCQFQDNSVEATPHIVGLYSREAINCHKNGFTMAGTITAIAAALVLLSLILTLFLYKQKKAPQRTSCCNKRVQEEGMQVEEQEMARDGESDNASAPVNVNGPVNAITFVVGWLKQQESNFFAKIMRKDKHLLIGTSESENAEPPEGWDTDEAQSVMTGEGQIEQDTCSDKQPMAINSSTNKSRRHDNLLAPDTPSHNDHNQTHEQHRLVAEKSDYIDDSYPKLALAASSDPSPQNSLCNYSEQSQGLMYGSNYITFARQPSIPEATAQDAQATTNDGSSRLAWAQQTNHVMSPQECESEPVEANRPPSLGSTGVTTFLHN